MATLTADAVISFRYFTLDAAIIAPYSRHDRGGNQHMGTQDTTTVVLSEAIGQYPAGTTVQVVLASMVARLVTLTSANHVFGSFTGDAFILPHFWADAVTLRTTAGSLTGDAVVTLAGPQSLTADAVLVRPASGLSFTANAFFV